MNYLHDFEKLHISTKTSVLTILGTLPFFYISVYLFKPDMIHIIKGNPFANFHFYYLISVCLVLSVMWYLMNLILGFRLVEYAVKKNEKTNQEKNHTKKTEGNPSAVFDQIWKRNVAYREQKKREKDLELKMSFSVSFIYSLFYLSIAIFLNQEFLQLDFKWFILSCFGFVVFRLIVLWIGIKITEETHEN